MGVEARFRIVLLLFVALALLIVLTSCEYLTFETNTGGEATTLIFGSDDGSIDGSPSLSGAGLNGNTYYVSMAGSDNNNGLSEENAFRTIQHAADLVQPGDTVYVLEGYYNERVKVSYVNGADNPVTFKALGDVTLDGGRAFETSWESYENGIYRIYKGRERIEIISFNGNKIPVLENNLSDIVEGSRLLRDDYVKEDGATGDIYTAEELLSMPSDKEMWIWDMDGQVNMWDVSYAYSANGDDDYFYLRFKNGENPNNYDITFNYDEDVAFYIYPANGVIIDGFNITNGEHVIHIRGDSSNNVIQNNIISNGVNRIQIQGTDSDNNIVRNNTIYSKFVSDYLPGAWNFRSKDLFSEEEFYDLNVKEAIYLVYKYWIGGGGSNDRGIIHKGAGNNNSYYNNVLYNNLIGIFIYGGASDHTYDTFVYNNTISAASSTCFVPFYYAINVQAYDNLFYDCNTPVRVGDIEWGNATYPDERSLYFYRNRIYQPVNVGDFVFFHSENHAIPWSGVIPPPTLYFYHNSFSGGDIGVSGFYENREESSSDTLFVNNIFSNYGRFSQNNYSNIHENFTFDYNYDGGSKYAYGYYGYSFPDNMPYWYGENNIAYDNVVYWNNPDIYTFDLEEGSELIDAGVDVSQPFVVDGRTYGPLPGFEEGYYSGSAPDIGAINTPSSCNDGIQNGGEDGIDCGGACYACDGLCQISSIEFERSDIARDEFVSLTMDGFNCDDTRITFNLYQDDDVPLLKHTFEQNFGDFLYPLIKYVDASDFSSDSSNFYIEAIPTTNVDGLSQSNVITVRNEISKPIKIEFPIYGARSMDVYHLDGSKTTYNDTQINDIISFVDQKFDLIINGKLYDHANHLYELIDYTDKPTVLYRSANTFPDAYSVGDTSSMFYNETLEWNEHEDWFLHNEGSEENFNTRLVPNCYSNKMRVTRVDAEHDWGEHFALWSQYYMKEDPLWDGVFYDNAGGVLAAHWKQGYITSESITIGSNTTSITLSHNVYDIPYCNVTSIINQDGETIFWESYENNIINLSQEIPAGTVLDVEYYTPGIIPTANYAAYPEQTAYMLNQTKQQLGSRLLTTNGALVPYLNHQLENNFYDYIDASMNEGVFHYPWYGVDMILTKSQWLSNLEHMKTLVDMGVMYIALSGIDRIGEGGATEEQVAQMAMYTFTSFLLAKNERSYFGFEMKPGSLQNIIYYDYWDTDIGDELGDYFIYGTFDGAQIFARNFENVLVLVNPDEVNATIPLGEVYTTLYGNDVSQVSLPSKSGIILYRSGFFNPVTICSDDIDNDNDGLVDNEDPGCHDGNLDSETLSDFEGYTIEELEDKFLEEFNTYYLPHIDNGTLNYTFGYGNHLLASLISMYEVTQNTTYIVYALRKTEATIADMEDVDGDGFNEWLYKYDHDNNRSTYGIQGSKAVAREVREMARLVRVIKFDPILNELYGARADSILEVIKHDVINQPYTDSIDRYRTVYTTMDYLASHFLEVLLEVYRVEGDLNFENESIEVSYYDIIEGYAQSMKESMFDNPSDSNALLWSALNSPYINFTYPDCYIIATDDGDSNCRDNGIGPYTSLSDVSHSESNVYSIVDLYRQGLFFNRTDMDRYVYTFLKFVWNNDVHDPMYHDHLDGYNVPPESKYDEYEVGSNIAPGWVSLGAFNDELEMVIENGDLSDVTNDEKLDEISLYAEIAKNKLVGDCQYSKGGIEVCDDIDNDCDGHIDENIDCTPPEEEEEEDNNNPSGGNNNNPGGDVSPPLPDNSPDDVVDTSSSSDSNAGGDTTPIDSSSSPEEESPSNFSSSTGNNVNSNIDDDSFSNDSFFSSIGSSISSIFISGGFGSFSLLIIIVLILVGGFGVVVYRKHSHVTYDLASLNNGGSIFSSVRDDDVSSSITPTASYNISSSPSLSPSLSTVSFDDFVTSYVPSGSQKIMSYLYSVTSSGLSDDQITSLLSNNGWSSEQVVIAFDNFRLLKSDFSVYKFLISCKNKGLSKHDASLRLIKNGWTEDQVLDKVNKYWVD